MGIYASPCTLSKDRRVFIVQNIQTPQSTRFLALSPAGMAAGLATLAFLKGILAIPILFALHLHMAGMAGRMRGGMPGGGYPGGGMPGGQMPGGSMPGGGMGPHQWSHVGAMSHMSAMSHLGVWLPLLWLAAIVFAAIGGALFAVVYNAVAAYVSRPRTQTPQATA